MSNVTINNDGGMSEAIDDLIQQWRNGGPTTQRRIVLSLAERAKLAEGRMEGVKRNLWSVVCDIWKDDEADELMSRLMKRAEKRKK
jgi:hypothetical protein